MQDGFISYCLCKLLAYLFHCVHYSLSPPRGAVPWASQSHWWCVGIVWQDSGLSCSLQLLPQPLTDRYSCPTVSGGWSVEWWTTNLPMWAMWMCVVFCCRSTTPWYSSEQFLLVIVRVILSLPLQWLFVLTCPPPRVVMWWWEDVVWVVRRYMSVILAWYWGVMLHALARRMDNGRGSSQFVRVGKNS